jgi:hypothetical protein
VATAIADRADGRPAVLLVEDLQWADESTVELFASLATNERLEGVLLVGAGAPEAVAGDHPLAASLETDLEAATGLELEPFGRDHVEELEAWNENADRRSTQRHGLGVYYRSVGEYERSTELLAAALSATREAGELASACRHAYQLALTARAREGRDAARSPAETGLEIARDCGMTPFVRDCEDLSSELPVETDASGLD